MNWPQRFIILAIMLFLHIVDDYYLQGCLAQLKQSKWWKENYPDKMYTNDYQMALFEHAFSWSFVITLPLLILSIITENLALTKIVLYSYFYNTSIHGFVDDLKANKKQINLITDQTIHFGQIIITWVFFNLII